MFKIVIIDDEALGRMLVKEYLQTFQQGEVVAECADGFSGLKAIQQHNPDLIFLDVQMPKITGFELLELLDEPPAVIFTTAFDEFAVKAFEANAIDYLLKPFSQERFNKAMEKFMERKAAPDYGGLLQQTADASTSRIVVKQNNNIRIIPAADILFLEAADDYVKVHTAEGSFLKNKTMSYFEQTLDAEKFVRIHRSHIVAVKHITRIDPYEKDSYLALLKHGQRLPVSKSGFARLRKVLDL